MSRWAQAAARLNSSLDGYYGETVTVLRPAPQRLVAKDDGVIRIAAIIATISETEEQLGAVRGREGFNLDIVAGEVVVSFSRTRFASKSDWPKRGEIIVANDRPVPAQYELSADAALDDGDRVNCRVVRRA